MKIVFKNCLLFTVLLVVSLSAKADNIQQDSVGRTIEGTAVMAESQSFGRRIEGVVIDPELDYMLLKFRGTTKNGKWLKFKGEIGVFSLKESKLMWTTPFDYRTSSAKCTQAGVVVTKGNKVSMLDAATGAVRWQGKFFPVLHPHAYRG